MGGEKRAPGHGSAPARIHPTNMRAAATAAVWQQQQQQQQQHAELRLHAQQKIASAAVLHSGLRVVGSLRPVLGRRGGLHARRRVATAKHCAGGLDAQRPAEEGGARSACEHGRRKTRNWRVKKLSSASGRCTRQADANNSQSGCMQSGRNNLRVRRTREAMSRRGPEQSRSALRKLPPQKILHPFVHVATALEV